MSNISFTRRLMLRQRARSHSTRPTSNYIAWPSNDIVHLHCAALASCRFGHMPVHICPAEKWWYMSRFAGTTNIPGHGSEASTLQHCTGTKQYHSRVYGNEYALIANSECRHMEYSSIIPGIYQSRDIQGISLVYITCRLPWQRGLARVVRGRRRSI